MIFRAYFQDGTHMDLPGDSAPVDREVLIAEAEQTSGPCVKRELIAQAPLGRLSMTVKQP